VTSFPPSGGDGGTSLFFNTASGHEVAESPSGDMVPRQGGELSSSPGGRAEFPWLTGPPSGPGTVLWTVPYIFLTEKYRTLWSGNSGTRFPVRGTREGAL